MRSESREIEFKFAVAASDAFARLVNHLELPESVLNGGVTQTNHFFDSASLCLRRSHFVIRLREYDGTSLLTIKGEQQSGKTGSAVLTDRIQEEVAIPNTVAADMLQGRTAPRQVIRDHFRDRSDLILQRINDACHDQELVRIGAFTNERIHLPPVDLATPTGSETVEFELDTSTFPGGRIDSEIEVEIQAHSDAAGIEAALVQLLERAGVVWHEAPSKAERFFDALENTDTR